MAIAVSSIVSPKVAGNNAGKALFPSSGPLFGIVADGSGSGPWDVVWNNGAVVAGIVQLALDEITEADTVVLSGFVGRRVKINSPAGQNNWGLCVCLAAYKRNAVNTLLLQNSDTGAFLEAAATDCEATA